MEQFKNSIPESIATYISDQKVKIAAEAAALADYYVLIHRPYFGELSMRNMGLSGNVNGVYSPAYSGRNEVKDRSKRSSDKVCNFCHKKGHLKADCYALKASGGGACGSLYRP